MENAANYDQLAKIYGFAPTPQCVEWLTQLVARQDLDLDEIARVINKDPSLKARLLRIANPRAESEDDYTVDTVEGALMRNGVGCALLLAMTTPLALALVATFKTMLSSKLETISRPKALLLGEEHMLGTIGFEGKASGRIYLRLSQAGAAQIASTILGIPAKDLGDSREVYDAVGELLNIITGGFKSHLCDAGLDCRLQPPEVRRTSDLHTPVVPGGGLERMAFRAGQITLFVDVTVNPWNRT